MKITQFEGSAEEFAAVAHIFPVLSSGEIRRGSRGKGEISPQGAIRSVLTRRKISKGQEAVYRALSNGRIEYGLLLKKTGRTGSEMAGVLGALGRRVANTPEIKEAGLPQHVGALLTWEEEGENRYYQLRQEALEVLRDLGVV